MAFVIPSKHIYNKDNDKLRDNKIDRIEVGTFEVVPNNEYETPVYNEDIIVENLISFENKEKENSAQMRNYGTTFYEDTIDYVYLDNIFKYKEGRIIIPKNRNNKFISKIFKGENEEKKIGFLVNGNTIKKQTSSTVLYTGYDEVGGKYYTKMETIYGEETENKTGAINFPDFPFSISSSSGGILNNNKASITGLQNETEVPISFSSDNLNYYIDYKILVYAKLEYLKGGANSLRGGLHTSPYPYNLVVSGSCDIYEGNEIEITVYGNTIGIDLTDKTIYVPNQSGNKPFFVEGNELMQKSNVCLDSSNLLVEYKDSNKAVIKFKDGISKSKNTYVTINIHNILNGEDYIRVKGRQEIIRAGETQTRDLSLITDEWIEITSAYTEDQISESFSKTLLSYSQGKESATIRCAIADYINYISATVVEYIKYDEENRVFCILDVKNDYLAQKILQAENLKIHGVECMVVDAEDTKIYINFYSLSIVPYLEKGTLTIPLKEISTTNNVGKMAFDIYDEVIPMVYTANQTDKPMSRYKDGSAKTFVVLGTKIYFDGAVWQELTLQEK